MEISSHLYPHYPKKAIHFYGLPRYMPLNAAFEGEAIQGSGCGYGQSSLQGAMGEFVERRHFFTEVPTNVIGKIHEHNNREDAEKLYSVINQIKNTSDQPEDFNFQLVKVSNIFDQHEVLLPKRFVSLGKVTLEDEKFIPLMDSSGIATHSSVEKSRRSSLNEFIERQALVGSWLGGGQIYQYDASVLFQISDIERLAKELVEKGDLSIFDIGSSLSGYTIAICFFSSDARDKVQYVIGVATAESLTEALRSALMELWQDYIYIYCYKIYSTPDSASDFLLYAGDTYHMSHFQDNTLETKKRIPYFDRATKKSIDLSECRHFSSDEMLINLKSISSTIYEYRHADRYENLYYTRILSPDFYLHMSIDKPLNFVNSFSKKLGIDFLPEDRERIPFP